MTKEEVADRKAELLRQVEVLNVEKTLGKLLDDHRFKAVITCDRLYWCWDVEMALMKLELDNVIREHRNGKDKHNVKNS